MAVTVHATHSRVFRLWGTGCVMGPQDWCCLLAHRRLTITEFTMASATPTHDFTRAEPRAHAPSIRGDLDDARWLLEIMKVQLRRCARFTGDSGTFTRSAAIQMPVSAQDTSVLVSSNNGYGVADCWQGSNQKWLTFNSVREERAFPTLYGPVAQQGAVVSQIKVRKVWNRGYILGLLN